MDSQPNWADASLGSGPSSSTMNNNGNNNDPMKQQQQQQSQQQSQPSPLQMEGGMNLPAPTDIPASSSSSSSFDPTNKATGGNHNNNNNVGMDEFLTRPYSTLDEPVMETIMRDVRNVGAKLRVVLLPLDRNSPFGYSGVSTEEIVPGENQREVINKLREWDLWGPLIVCLFLSVVLAIRSPNNQSSAVFASVFITVWLGSSIVTLNAQLLGGTISFFQSVCVLGYCVFPLSISAVVIGIMNQTPMGVFWIDMIWVQLGLVWATRASMVFIGQYIAKERRVLAVFPVLFFYVFLGWLVLLF